MSDFVGKLRDIVGDKGLILDDREKHPFLTDWRENYLGKALAIVRPATTEGQRCLQFAVDVASGDVHLHMQRHPAVGTHLPGKAGVDAVIEMDLAANAKLYPGLLHARSTVVVYGTGNAEAAIPAQFLLVNAIPIRFVYVYELTAGERAALTTCSWISLMMPGGVAAGASTPTHVLNS